MKIQYKGLNGVTMRSNGIHFLVGVEYEVTEKVGKYLLDTFGAAFEAKATPKPKEKKAAPKYKKEVVEETPKED